MRNPKLLSLLRQGCTVIYPSGYFLEGDTESNLIATGIIDIQSEDKTGTGYRTLSENGLEFAIDDEEEYSEGRSIEQEMKRQEAKEELHG